MSNASVLSINKLSKRFTSKKAVNELTFSVNRGEAFCLLGGNGAGKTTTLNMLLGFLKPDTGTAVYENLDMWHERNSCRSKIFYLPENVSLYPEFSAIENLQYLAQLASISVSKKEIYDALIEVGLDARFHEQPTSSYSKGMRQKTCLAFARLKGATLLLLDEPTSGLDPKAIKEFVRLIQELKAGGATVVMITHDLQCAHSLADQIGILQSGILVQKIENNDVSLDDIEQQYFQFAG